MLRARISDKELVKGYIEEKIGPGFTAKTLAVLRSKQEVTSFYFPSTCAIKSTHASGHVILRRDDTPPPDLSKIVQWLDVDYYEAGREPNYRRLQPKIIVEELVIEAEEEAPRDYKVFCIHGKPVFIQVDIDRFSSHHRSFYSPRWRELAFDVCYPRPLGSVPPPLQLNRMLDLARVLCKDFSFVRVDFYALESRLLVGELTHFPGNCKERFFPDRADYLVGRLFREPEIDVEQLLGTREAT